jgi:tRNA(fMet)-specific endonuclease VapC
MKQYIIDTDILSFYLRGDTIINKRFDQYFNHYDRINFSLITYFEIQSGLLSRDLHNRLNHFQTFCSRHKIIGLSLSAVNIASHIVATLNKKGTPLDTQDILIAATAIENDFVLVTNNTKHFARIENLEIENWKQP